MIIIELGCGMVGNVGMIKVEVVLILKKLDNDEYCWVFLDIGKFGGLVEMMDEVICYLICMECDVDDMGFCVLVGLICDFVDVFYEKNMYLFLFLFIIGDEVLIEGMGVYMMIYLVVVFNGFDLLKFYCI